jgi:hypothetical protein
MIATTAARTATAISHHAHAGVPLDALVCAAGSGAALGAVGDGWAVVASAVDAAGWVVGGDAVVGCDGDAWVLAAGGFVVAGVVVKGVDGALRVGVAVCVAGTLGAGSRVGVRVGSLDVGGVAVCVGTVDVAVRVRVGSALGPPPDRDGATVAVRVGVGRLGRLPLHAHINALVNTLSRAMASAVRAPTLAALRSASARRAVGSTHPPGSRAKPRSSAPATHASREAAWRVQRNGVEPRRSAPAHQAGNPARVAAS